MERQSYPDDLSGQEWDLVKNIMTKRTNAQGRTERYFLSSSFRVQLEIIAS